MWAVLTKISSAVSFFPPSLDSFLCGHSGLFRVMWIRTNLLISSLIPILWSNTSGHQLLAGYGARSRIGQYETSRHFKSRQLWNGRRRGRCKQTNHTKKSKVSKPTKLRSKRSANTPIKKQNFKDCHIFYHPKYTYLKKKWFPLTDVPVSKKSEMQFCSTSCIQFQHPVLFNILRFSNEVCDAGDGTEGVCYTGEECTEKVDYI